MTNTEWHQWKVDIDTLMTNSNSLHQDYQELNEHVGLQCWCWGDEKMEVGMTDQDELE